MKKDILPMSLLAPILAQNRTKGIAQHLKAQLESLKTEYHSLPPGQLYIKKNRKWLVYYVKHNGQLRGIGKNTTLIYQLARRQYLALLIHFIGELLDEINYDDSDHTISRFLPRFDELFQRFEKGLLDIDRITMTPNQYIWNSDRSSKKNTRRDDLIYPTNGRIYMRTKSEQMLGNLLEKLHIPYRYEFPLYINGITYHPDFIIMLPDDQLIIIEHAGRLDLGEYNDALVERLKAYNSIGLLIGRDVFFTFERDTRDETIAKEVLFQAFSATPSNNRYLRRAANQVGCHFHKDNS